MCNFATTETYGSLHLVSILQELYNIAIFCLVVMFLDISAEPYFLNIHNFLVFASFFLFLLLLITEFTVVHNATYWWFCCWSNINKIEIHINRHLQCFT